MIEKENRGHQRQKGADKMEKVGCGKGKISRGLVTRGNETRKKKKNNTVTEGKAVVTNRQCIAAFTESKLINVVRQLTSTDSTGRNTN